MFTDQNAVLQAAATLAGSLLIARATTKQNTDEFTEADCAVTLKMVLDEMAKAGVIPGDLVP